MLVFCPTDTVVAIETRPESGTYYINTTTILEVPIEEAFWFAADSQNDPVWRLETKTAWGEGPLRVGKKFREKINLEVFLPYLVRNRYWEFPMHVTKLDPPHSIELYTDPTQEMADFYVHVIREFKEENGKTRFNWIMEVDNRVPRFLFAPTFGLTPPIFLVQQTFAMLESYNCIPLQNLMNSGRYKKRLAECEPCQVFWINEDEPVSDAEIKRETDAAETEPASEAETEPEPEPELEPEAEPAPETEPEPKTEPVHEAKPEPVGAVEANNNVEKDKEAEETTAGESPKIPNQTGEVNPPITFLSAVRSMLFS